MGKLPTKVWVVAALVLGLVAAFRAYEAKAAEATDLRLQLHSQITLNHNVVARNTVAEAAKDSLKAQLEAARELNGKLVVALKIRVAAQDTLITHDSLPTTERADSGRTAHFRDSSFAGTVEGTVVAPPGNTPLGITLHFHQPEFTPSVGIVKVGTQYVAVVDWQGRASRVAIEAPYYNPGPPALPTFGYWVEALYGLPGNSVDFRGGPAIRLPRHLTVLGGISTEPRLFVGIHKEW